MKKGRNSSLTFENEDNDSDSESVSNEDWKNKFESEKLLNKKTMRGQTFYLVKWKGYSSSQATWEPITSFTPSAMKLIREYEQNQSRKVIIQSSSSESSSFLEEEKKQKKDDVILISDSQEEYESESDSRDFESESQSINNFKPNLTKKVFKFRSKAPDMKNDLAKRILNAKIVNDREVELSCLVEFEKRPSGYRPEPKWFSSKLIRIFAPQILIDFYESRISLIKRKI